MLRRKAYEELRSWKEGGPSGGMLVMGARQVGKTTLIRAFAQRTYASVLEINFYENPQAVSVISAARDTDDFFMRLSALGKAQVVPGNTLMFLDEIQECGDSLTWLKFLVERTDCDYIYSGSRLGLDSFDPRSLPVGFLQTHTMHPLDFEEFCWAEGILPEVLEVAKTCLGKRTPLPDYLHDMLMDTFYRYVLVGGMPSAVQRFEETKSLPNVRAEQRRIQELYKYDIAKYVEDKVEARQIRMVYDAIPGQLNNQNKRFKYTRLGRNLRFANLETAFDWLTHAGVAISATRVGEPLFPLGMYEDVSSLKLYANDVGILTSQLMGDVDVDILSRRSTINFGSIFENAAAQELCAHGFEPHYYQSRKVGEIDYVLQRKNGEVLLCEIKSGKDYRRHSALSNLLATKNYSISDALVFCDSNISQKGKVLYLPIYLLGFLGDTIEGGTK